MRFSGAMQFSTFTRWCWMLQGLYYLVALASCAVPRLVRLAQVLFGMSVATAFLVTAVVYMVLVPGALFMEQPPHRKGSIQLLFSAQGHIMHCLNAVFIIIDFTVSPHAQQMCMADLPYGVLFGGVYVVFEWIFHARTGMWHYPFLDYDKNLAEVAYLLLFLAFVAFWWIGSQVTHLRSDVFRKVATD